MHDDNEIGGTRADRKSRALIEELEAANLAGGDVFPQTEAEIRGLGQIEQSAPIVASCEKRTSVGINVHRLSTG